MFYFCKPFYKIELHYYIVFEINWSLNKINLTCSVHSDIYIIIEQKIEARAAGNQSMNNITFTLSNMKDRIYNNYSIWLLFTMKSMTHVNFLQSSFNRRWFLTVKQKARMVCMKYFCFHFPVRLWFYRQQITGKIKRQKKNAFRFGVLVTSVISCLETLIILIYWTMNDVDYFKSSAKMFQENIEEYSSNAAFDTFLEFAESCKWINL